MKGVRGVGGRYKESGRTIEVDCDEAKEVVDSGGYDTVTDNVFEKELHGDCCRDGDGLSVESYSHGLRKNKGSGSGDVRDGREEGVVESSESGLLLKNL